MKINGLLSEEDILMDLSCHNKEDAIASLVDNLNQYNHLFTKADCLRDILDREQQISTGLVKGIAIPHTQSASVKDCKISIASLHDEIEWKTLDETQVKIIILITVPSQGEEVHLKILASLAEKLMDDTVCEALRNAETEKEIIAILEE